MLLRNIARKQETLGIYNFDEDFACDTFNSSPSSAAYMRQLIESALVQILACRQFGAKPISKPMLGYCKLDHLEQTSVKL